MAIEQFNLPQMQQQMSPWESLEGCGHNTVTKIEEALSQLYEQRRLVLPVRDK